MAEIDVTYSLDGVSFSSMGVYVSGSTGIIGKPGVKDHLKADWSEHNGTMRDLQNLRYDGKSVELNCFIVADGYGDFLSKAQSFLSILENGTLHTLVCTVGARSFTMPNMYQHKEIKITKNWNPAKMIGTFNLKLDQSVPTSVPGRVTVFTAPSYTNDGDVHYSVDGVDFNTHGVMVTASSGLFDKPSQKAPLTVDWNDANGVQMYTGAPALFNERTIELSCTVYAETYSAFIQKATAFANLFGGTGTHRLRVWTGTKPLVYEVYAPNEISIKPNGWDAVHQVGTFSVKLVEPEPVKIVLQMSGSASITIASTTIAHIYWGDGSHIYNVSGDGTAQTVQHTFTGTYEVIITVETTSVSKLTHNGTVLWNRLV